MRVILILFFLIHFDYCQSQSRIEGKYRDHFGYSIDFRTDSTFEFNYQFDLASGWANGIWKKNGNIILLTPIPVMDTLTSTTNLDSLVLSLDMKPERISEEQFAIDYLTSGGQLPSYPPKKLLFKKERLYKYDKNGRVKKKKIKGLFTNKKFDPWYFKID